jgi:hypothetical protein
MCNHHPNVAHNEIKPSGFVFLCGALMPVAIDEEKQWRIYGKNRQLKAREND